MACFSVTSILSFFFIAVLAVDVHIPIPAHNSCSRGSACIPTILPTLSLTTVAYSRQTTAIPEGYIVTDISKHGHHRYTKNSTAIAISKGSPTETVKKSMLSLVDHIDNLYIAIESWNGTGVRFIDILLSVGLLENLVESTDHVRQATGYLTVMDVAEMLLPAAERLKASAIDLLILLIRDKPKFELAKETSNVKFCLNYWGFAYYKFFSEVSEKLDEQFAKLAFATSVYITFFVYDEALHEYQD